MTTFIKSIPITGLNLLGVGGQPVVRTYRQLQSTIAQALGQEAANLFARPILNPGSGPVDWYAPDKFKPGAVTQLRDLPEAKRQQVRDEVEGHLERIRDHARTLAASGNADQAKLADRLEKAAQFPSDEFIFLVGDQPVITCWGCAAEATDRGPVELVRAHEFRQGMPGSAQQSVGPVAAAMAVTRRLLVYKPGFPWAALLLMLILFGFLTGISRSLIPACGVTWPLMPTSWSNVWCTEVAAAVVEPNGPEQDTADLERQLADLRRGLQAKVCEVPRRVAEAPPPPEPDPPPPPPPPQCNTNRAITDAGGKVGRINVALKWSGPADLDLNVTCPNGQRISFNHPSACGGQLDVDMNYKGARSDDPIENIVFSDGSGSAGQYVVGVIHSGYQNVRGSSDPVPFEIIILYKGQEVRRVSGEIGPKRSNGNVVVFNPEELARDANPADTPPECAAGAQPARP